MEFIGVIFIFALAFLPTIIANNRYHNNAGAIVVTNIIGGMLAVIGLAAGPLLPVGIIVWLVALIWAMTDNVNKVSETTADTDAKDATGATPLHVAEKSGHAETLIALVNAGENIDEKHKNDLTPLHLAVAKGQTETAHALVKEGADVFARTSEGKTPLDIAINVHGKDSVIAIFLQKVMQKKGTTNEQKAEELLRDLE